MSVGITPDSIKAYAIVKDEKGPVDRIALDLIEDGLRTVIWLTNDQAVKMARELLNPR